MKRLPSILPILCLLALASTAPAEDLTKQIQDLKQERVALLKKQVALVQAQHRQGQTSTTEVIQASLQLLEAELDAATEPKQRVALRKEMLQHMKQLEQMVKDQVQQGTVSSSELLKAKTQRLDAEIRYLEEKAKS